MILTDARQIAPDAEREGDVIPTFCDWLDGKETSLRDTMTNDFALWGSRPCDYLHIAEQEIAALYSFYPDYVDWACLRAIPRDEWHRIVQEYYEMLYQIDFCPTDSGRRPYLTLMHALPALEAKRERLWKEWCPCPNPLHERRLRLNPQIAYKY